MKKLVATVISAIMLVCGAITCASCTEQREKLVVYTEAGFAPFEYNDNQAIVGVDVDIMNKVGKKLGMKVVFEDVSFDTIIDAVEEGKLTNVGAAGLSITEERQKKVDFSNPYYTATLYVIYQKSQKEALVSNTTDEVEGIYWDSLAGKNIAVQNGTTADLFLGDELADGGTIYDTGAQKTGFAFLATAVADIGLNSDVLIIDELPAKKLIEGKDNLACAPLYYQGGDGEADEAAVDTYAIAVTKGKTEILNAINEVLAELGPEGIQALVDKHLGL